jgi:hypothetical protein
MVGMLYLVFAIIVSITFDVEDHGNVFTLPSLILLTYVTLLMMTFIASLGVDPKNFESLFRLISILFGMYMVIGLGCMGFFWWSVFQEEGFTIDIYKNALLAGGIATGFLFAIPLCTHG